MRHGRFAVWLLLLRRVIPLFVSGLHCGWDVWALRMSGIRAVIPLFVSGLHCGEVDWREAAKENPKSSRSW